jgi:hypothetical protein
MFKYSVASTFQEVVSRDSSLLLQSGRAVLKGAILPDLRKMESCRMCSSHFMYLYVHDQENT